jgi:hypothetical protein
MIRHIDPISPLWFVIVSSPVHHMLLDSFHQRCISFTKLMHSLTDFVSTQMVDISGVVIFLSLSWFRLSFSSRLAMISLVDCLRIRSSWTSKMRGETIGLCIDDFNCVKTSSICA